MELSPKFIVLEGLDGSGKTTQAKIIQKELEKIGIKSLITAEPTDHNKEIIKQGSNTIGKLIREILDSHNVLNLFSLQLLFSADRGYHQAEIKQILQNGYWVICDRYKFSTLSYILSNKEGKKYFKILEQINNKFLTPDYTILIDYPAEKCIKQLDESRNNKDFFEQIEKLEKIRKAYLKLAKKYKIKIIERENKTEEELGASIVNSIKSKFNI